RTETKCQTRAHNRRSSQKPPLRPSGRTAEELGFGWRSHGVALLLSTPAELTAKAGFVIKRRRPSPAGPHPSLMRLASEMGKL
ncbi:MAG TPA: hypothetical protein VE986_03865, partial [Hyphomicrobiales bacterium]|nr:hypothetical protein [Hyphomicrobiales bacterium]